LSTLGLNSIKEYSSSDPMSGHASTVKKAEEKTIEDKQKVKAPEKTQQDKVLINKEVDTTLSYTLSSNGGGISVKMKNEQTGDVIREFTIKAADLPATKKQNFTIKGTQVDLTS
jgi:uncharacterized FlaG/YvyC family protein